MPESRQDPRQLEQGDARERHIGHLLQYLLQSGAVEELFHCAHVVFILVGVFHSEMGAKGVAADRNVSEVGEGGKFAEEQSLVFARLDDERLFDELGVADGDTEGEDAIAASFRADGLLN